jgi:prophage antirepressor-like protein
MQYALKVFKTDDHLQFRTFDIEGEPWFSLTDVCAALDLKNASDAASRLDEDEKSSIHAATPGGTQKIRTINESGLWNLVMRSDKPQAKKLKKFVTSVVLPSIRKTGGYGKAPMPLFLQRYSANHGRVAAGHFSVIQVLATHLYGPMEFDGHVLPDAAPNGKEIRPENSVGRMFSSWLKVNHPDVCDNYSYYLHWTPQAEFPARQYPNTMYAIFLTFLQEVWIPESVPYFIGRDPAALPHLPKLLPANDAAAAGMMRRPTLPRRG